MELPEEMSSRGSKSSKTSSSRRVKGHLPIVWPGLGIWIPEARRKEKGRDLGQEAVIYKVNYISFIREN